MKSAALKFATVHFIQAPRWKKFLTPAFDLACALLCAGLCFMFPTWSELVVKSKKNTSCRHCHMTFAPVNLRRKWPTTTRIHSCMGMSSRVWQDAHRFNNKMCGASSRRMLFMFEHFLTTLFISKFYLILSMCIIQTYNI